MNIIISNMMIIGKKACKIKKKKKKKNFNFLTEYTSFMEGNFSDFCLQKAANSKLISFRALFCFRQIWEDLKVSGDFKISAPLTGPNYT